MNDQANVSHAPRDVRKDPLTNVLPIFGNVEHTGFAPRKKFIAKGHDAQLMDAQFGNLETVITTMSGSEFVGTIVKRDKFTITLRHCSETVALAGQDEIFYKHAIESVRIARKLASAH